MSVSSGSDSARLWVLPRLIALGGASHTTLSLKPDSAALWPLRLLPRSTEPECRRVHLEEGRVSPEPDSNIPADGMAASRTPGGSLSGSRQDLGSTRVSAGERTVKGRSSGGGRAGTKLALSCRRRQKTVGSQRLPSSVPLLSPLRIPPAAHWTHSLTTPSERLSASDLQSSSRPHVCRSPICLSVGASSGIATACQGLHRPARGHHDDPKALFQAGRHVDRRTHTSGTGHAIFLTDGQDLEQSSFDLRVRRVAPQPHRHGQVSRTSPDGTNALDLAEDIRQVGDPTDVFHNPHQQQFPVRSRPHVRCVTVLLVSAPVVRRQRWATSPARRSVQNRARQAPGDSAPPAPLPGPLYTVKMWQDEAKGPASTSA